MAYGERIALATGLSVRLIYHTSAVCLTCPTAMLQGFTEVWSDAHTVLTCEPAANTMPAWVIPTAATVTTIGIIFLAIVALLAWYRIAVQLRRRWQREKEVLLCRQKGVPNGGQASIVVTDVEGYSGQFAA